MAKRIASITLCLLFSLFVFIVSCSSDSGIIENSDGTFSLENGIFLRHYEGYSEESQLYLSVLDACYSMIGAYSEIIDPYVNGEKSFEDGQWDVIDSEIRYMSAFSCSWVMQADVPEEFSEHADDVFYAAHNLMIANDLLMMAIRFDDSGLADTASYYYGLSETGLNWWLTAYRSN